jgi:hypothetical protein
MELSQTIGIINLTAPGEVYCLADLRSPDLIQQTKSHCRQIFLSSDEARQEIKDSSVLVQNSYLLVQCWFKMKIITLQNNHLYKLNQLN